MNGILLRLRSFENFGGILECYNFEMCVVYAKTIVTLCAISNAEITSDP